MGSKGGWTVQAPRQGIMVYGKLGAAAQSSSRMNVRPIKVCQAAKKADWKMISWWHCLSNRRLEDDCRLGQCHYVSPMAPFI